MSLLLINSFILKVSSGGRKSRILMSMSIAAELRDHLQAFDENLRTLGLFLIQIKIRFYCFCFSQAMIY